MLKLDKINPRKVIVSREYVRVFNRMWPCSPLSSDRHYWFEFDEAGDLVDHDVPNEQDGDAASALSQDASEFLKGDLP